MSVQNVVLIPLVGGLVVLGIVWLIVALLTRQRGAMRAASQMVLEHEHMSDAERMLVLLEGINRRLLPVTILSVLILVLLILGFGLLVFLALMGDLALGGLL